MYTRCPECRTPFKITHTQLTAREGLVRCGKCDAIFLAGEQLLPPPLPDLETVFDVRKKTARSSTRKRRKHKSVRARGGKSAQRGSDPAIPTISELSFVAKRRRIHPLIWGLLTLTLLLLAGQVIYFYPDEIAQNAALKPSVAELCRLLGCKLEPPPPPPPPELRETAIAPHPRFANALRIRAVMVNRAAVARPYPLMGVTLTDNNGAVLARRTFAPRQYLGHLRAEGRMEPNVAVNALIDVMNPDGNAVGYEIQLLERDEIPPN